MIDSEEQVKRVEIIKQHVKQNYKMLDTLHVHCTVIQTINKLSCDSYYLISSSW